MCWDRQEWVGVAGVLIEHHEDHVWAVRCGAMVCCLGSTSCVTWKRGLGFLNLSLLISKMGVVLIPFPQGVRIERDKWALGYMLMIRFGSTLQDLHFHIRNNIYSCSITGMG